MCMFIEIQVENVMGEGVGEVEGEGEGETEI